ncbi:hypothetical protein H2256_00680 [Campylobacter sp. RM9929]|uniref:hypothetical protein n=1 Tax=Campylobacter molothri TaxID=1032242 RepID=UPI001D27250D|nr:hypothetical protein [Campylobacter sp. RM9929]
MPASISIPLASLALIVPEFSKFFIVEPLPYIFDIEIAAPFLCLDVDSIIPLFLKSSIVELSNFTPNLLEIFP